jgi:flagellar hook protein FlgE
MLTSSAVRSTLESSTADDCSTPWLPEAGTPLVGTPSSGSLGVLQSSAVEDSNVDLTAELVNLITAQRAYQANAQTIKAQDAILQTAVNLR